MVTGEGWYCIVDHQVVVQVITYPCHLGNTPDIIGIRDIALADSGQGPAMFRPRRLVKATYLEALVAALPDLRDYCDDCDAEISRLRRRKADALRLILSADQAQQQ